MKAEHIYINANGVPCAPTKEVPDSRAHPDGYLSRSCKASCIPIREEDRQWVGLWLLDSTVKEKPDTFYPVEPYEFEVDTVKTGERVVKTNGYPTGHETYYHEVARIIRPSNPIYGDALHGKAPKEAWDQYHKLLSENLPEAKTVYDAGNWNRTDVHNYNVRKYNESSEPKAGPSKELTDEEIEKAATKHRELIKNEDGSLAENWWDDGYETGFKKGAKFARDRQKEIGAPKFKTLEDYGWKDDHSVSTPLADYRVVEYKTKTSWFIRNGPRWSDPRPCDNLDHGKQLAQNDHEKKCKSLLK